MQRVVIAKQGRKLLLMTPPSRARAMPLAKETVDLELAGFAPGSDACRRPMKWPAKPAAALVAQKGTSGSCTTSEPAASTERSGCQSHELLLSTAIFPASNNTSGLMGVRSLGWMFEPRLYGLRLFAGTAGSVRSAMVVGATGVDDQFADGH